MSFEQVLQQKMFAGKGEKTFVDKVLAKDDIESIRGIVKKDKLTRSDLLELLYLLSSAESKLLNYGAWDRYVILKFFVWIRDFVKVAELLYDYQDQLKKKASVCKVCNSEEKTHGKEHAFESSFVITQRTQALLDNNERLIEHNVKFLVDLYLNIGRTTLSIGGTGLLEILQNKYEISYPDQAKLATAIQEQNRRVGLMGR